MVHSYPPHQGPRRPCSGTLRECSGQCPEHTAKSRQRPQMPLEGALRNAWCFERFIRPASTVSSPSLEPLDEALWNFSAFVCSWLQLVGMRS